MEHLKAQKPSNNEKREATNIIELFSLQLDVYLCIDKARTLLKKRKNSRCDIGLVNISAIMADK